ncbi:MAG: hypothetical protein ACWGQW_01260 [bacterium]
MTLFKSRRRKELEKRLRALDEENGTLGARVSHLEQELYYLKKTLFPSDIDPGESIWTSGYPHTFYAGASDFDYPDDDISLDDIGSSTISIHG